jgi:NAD(P)-dependent dehydrogenase (short-subunit alcohol dehydrogenase family)
MDLTGRVALVTGASRGLGFLLARELAREGCRVAICARDAAELDRAREALKAEGATVLAVPCDVADRSQVEALVERVVAELGSLDVLVPNAGIIQAGPVETMRVEDFADAMGSIFWGVVYPTLAALPHLKAVGGRVVTITSLAGKIPAPHLLPYDCAKHAAVAFSEGLAPEVAASGVRVTTVVPGLMRTGSPLNAFFKGQAEREYSWFTLSDSIPGLSMDAERAARRIVSAMKHGRAELTLTLPAKIATRVHGVAPATTVRVLSVVDRLLPSAGGSVLTGPDGARARRGAEVDPSVTSRAFRVLTGLTRKSADRFLQKPGPVGVSPAVRTAQEEEEVP